MTASPAGQCRVWAEFVPHRALSSASILAPLARRSIRLIVAVMPDSAASAADVVAACRDHGVAVALWPMLDNAHGRWASTANLAAFTSFVTALIDGLAGRGLLPDELAIDLEPPYAVKTRPLRGFRAIPRRRRDVARARTSLGVLLADLAGLGLAVSAAIAPLLVVGPASARRGWQRVLGTPVCDVPFDHLSVMAYSSLFEGYTRGFLGRADARALLFRIARASHRLHGARAGVSLGCIGTGAFGDERVYRSPAELADDVAIARAAAVTDLALFDLGGALARPPLTAWLDALVADPPARSLGVPRDTARASALWHLASLTGQAGRIL